MCNICQHIKTKEEFLQAIAEGKFWVPTPDPSGSRLLLQAKFRELATLIVERSPSTEGVAPAHDVCYPAIHDLEVAYMHAYQAMGVGWEDLFGDAVKYYAEKRAASLD